MRSTWNHPKPSNSIIIGIINPKSHQKLLLIPSSLTCDAKLKSLTTWFMMFSMTSHWIFCSMTIIIVYDLNWDLHHYYICASKFVSFNNLWLNLSTFSLLCFVQNVLIWIQKILCLVQSLLYDLLLYTKLWVKICIKYNFWVYIFCDQFGLKEEM